MVLDNLYRFGPAVCIPYSRTFIALRTRARICERLWSPGIDSASLVARRAGMISLAESIPWNQFLGSLNIYKFGFYALPVLPTREQYP
jgi:hypothetical protein